MPTSHSRLFGSVLGIFVCAVALLASRVAGAQEKGSANFKIYVSNEGPGDVSVIDGRSGNPVALIPAGKRPRGIQLSPDGRTLYVATSGSARLGPGADQERAKDHKADKSADGIVVVDLASPRVLRRIAVGSDPERIAVTADGTRVIVSHEDESSGERTPMRADYVEPAG